MFFAYKMGGDPVPKLLARTWSDQCSIGDVEAAIVELLEAVPHDRLPDRILIVQQRDDSSDPDNPELAIPPTIWERYVDGRVRLTTEKPS